VSRPALAAADRRAGPLHADAVATLTGWTAPDAGQEPLRRAYVRRLADGAGSLSRAGRPDHLTASCLVLDAAGERTLLVLHRKLGRWVQPGGHLEAADTTLAGAALREAAEETGLAGLVLLAPGPARLDRHPAPCRPDVRDHLDVQYVARAAAQAATVASAESLDVAWWPVTALPETADGAVRALVARAVELATHPGHPSPSPDLSEPGSATEAAARPSR
jgi:8-oxo-dGTP pyrophosphatase MutT (NUDIX family)